MKAITCECGAELQADDAQALARTCSWILSASHPDRDLSEEEILKLITAEARDV